MEIGSPSTRSLEFCPEQNDRLLRETLLLVDNIRDIASRRDEHYKRTAARYHYSNVLAIREIERELGLEEKLS